MSFYDLMKQVNLGNSRLFTDGSARPNYAPVRDAVIRPVQPNGGSFWANLLGKTRERTSEYFSNPENLLKLGIGAVGGLAGYRSGRAAEKRQEQFDNFRMQMAQQQNQRYNAAEAQRAKYDQPRAYASARKAVAQPTVDPNTGEVLYFEDNKLTGEQLPDNAKTIFAAEGGSITVEELLRRLAGDRKPAPPPREPYQPGTRWQRAASGGYFEGGTSGQSDKIPAMLSDGEFVIDAETVAMLGDGNNAAGASALEQMRQNIRKQKRSAPKDKIPPKAKKPEQYMKKGKK
jgi:hypothetical protein